MKYLKGEYCSGHVGSFVKKSLEFSGLVYCPVPLIPSRLSYKQPLTKLRSYSELP